MAWLQVCGLMGCFFFDAIVRELVMTISKFYE